MSVDRCMQETSSFHFTQWNEFFKMKNETNEDSQKSRMKQSSKPKLVKSTPKTSKNFWSNLVGGKFPSKDKK